MWALRRLPPHGRRGDEGSGQPTSGRRQQQQQLQRQDSGQELVESGKTELSGRGNAMGTTSDSSRPAEGTLPRSSGTAYGGLGSTNACAQGETGDVADQTERGELSIGTKTRRDASVIWGAVGPGISRPHAEV